MVTVDGFLAFHLTSKAILFNANSQEALLPTHDYLAKIDSSLLMIRDGDIGLFV